MKWFKENWLNLFLVGIIIFLLINSVVRSKTYKGDIKAKDALIESLMVEYQVLEDSAVAIRKTAEIHKSATLRYLDTLQNTRVVLINQKKRYEKQVADLTRIPTDTLYRDLSDWYNSLSVLWGAGTDDGSR